MCNFKPSLLVNLIVVIAFISITVNFNSVQAADFFDKKIELIVPFQPGGGSDQWAQFYAPKLSNALPGNPEVVIKFMTGGGSTKGTNYFAKNAKLDGLTILCASGSTHFSYLMGDSRVEYDYKDWQALLVTPTSGIVSISPKAKVSKATDLKNAQIPLIYGSIGITSLDLLPLLAFEMLGVEVEALFGMKGRSASREYFEKGIVTIDYQTTAAHLAKVVPLIKSGKSIPIMSWGVLDKEGDIVRDPTFPDIPTFPEVYEKIHGEKPSGITWQAWKALFIAGFSAQKILFLPKDTPNDVKEAYAQALETVFTQPYFVKSAEQHLGLYSQKIGQDAENALDNLISVDPEAINWIKGWAQKKYQVTFK